MLKLSIKKLWFNTQNFTFTPGVSSIQDKWAICTSSKNSTYECVNLFTHREIVTYQGKVIDMNPPIISIADILGQSKTQHFMGHGYKYSTAEYPTAVTQSDCDLGSRFLDQHYEAIEKIMQLNYEQSLTLNLDKYTEITVKIIASVS
jgi:hypothetical protein